MLQPSLRNSRRPEGEDDDDLHPKEDDLFQKEDDLLNGDDVKLETEDVSADRTAVSLVIFSRPNSPMKKSNNTLKCKSIEILIKMIWMWKHGL